jgi:hypothetical protein
MTMALDKVKAHEVRREKPGPKAPNGAQLPVEPVAFVELHFESPLPRVQSGTGTFPAGKRIYIKYDGTLNGPEIEEPMTIGNSCDWALVRTDGFLVLDARLSAATKPDPNNEKAPVTHLSITWSGLANLAELYDGDDKKDPYKAWLAGKPPVRAKMNVTLAARIETSGPQEPNAALRYRIVSANADKYVALSQAVFFGTGVVHVSTDAKDKVPEIQFLKGMSVNIQKIVT